MHRIFLPLFHYFQRHKFLLYSLLVISTLVFAWYGRKLYFEEDIIKLLPRSSTSNELAFSDIGLVDKIFVQVTSRDTLNPVPTRELGAIAEEYCTLLQQRDSASGYLSGVLVSLSIDTALEAMDFGLTHLPTFIDTAWYAQIAQALEPEAFAQQMEQNYERVMADETGEESQLISMDPLNLRSMLGEVLGTGANAGGITIEDGHLYCPDKTVALAFLSTSFSSTNSGAGTRLVRMMDKLKLEVEAEHPDIRIYMHGNPQGGVSNASTIKRDLAWSLGLSLLLILVIMLFSFHKLAFVWQQVVPVLYGAVFSMACMYWIKGTMSLMALGISAIVLGVAISYCLHVLIHYYYVGSAEQMLREESTPVVLGCLTTIGAFVGLLFTESDLLRDFGLFATFALIGNTLFALIFLPHFLRPEQIHYKRTHGFPLVERINNLPWDRNKWFIMALVFIIVVGVVFSPRVQFDSDLMNLNYHNEELKASQNLYNSKFSDGYAHQYFAAWDEDNLDRALEHNKGLVLALDSLQKEGLVKSYIPVAKLLLHAEKDQWERIHAWEAFWSRGRVRELRRLLSEAEREYQLPRGFYDPFLSIIQTRYEPGDLVTSGIVPEGLLSNYVERQESGRYMVFTEVAYDAKDQAQVWKDLASQDHVLVLEPFYYCRDMVEIVHDDFSTTLWISSLFVLIVLLVSFRNLWIALIAFFPMFVSWYVMQGYMALLGLEFNLINIVISTFIYGIGVDYSIFVMEGLLTEARRGQNEMLRYHKVAIFYSALVLGIVTFSLVFARHPAIHSIGLITLIGMASTISITYSLQPWVFRKLAKIPFFRRSFRIPD